MNWCDTAEDTGRGGSLLKEATVNYYRQWSATLELLEVCYSGGCAWLKGAQAVKWGGIPGVTPWFEDPLGHKKNR